MGNIRCTVCGFTVTPQQAEEQNLDRCPNCGHDGVPCDTGDDVQVNINWHELRILVMWAERWAISMGKRQNVVYAIAERLAAQHQGRSPLTFAGELGDVRDAGYKVQSNFPGVEGVSVPIPQSQVISWDAGSRPQMEDARRELLRYMEHGHRAEITFLDGSKLKLCRIISGTGA